MNRIKQDPAGIRVRVAYQYVKDGQKFRFSRWVEVDGQQSGHTVVTEISRVELMALKMFQGSHHKRASQFAQYLCEEMHTEMRRQMRMMLAHKAVYGGAPMEGEPWAKPHA